nr:uracil phosphoribosyltransferase [Haladaptatus sp. W1]
MTIEKRGDAHLITHAMAKDTLSKIRDEETEQVGFRKGLVKLGRICGYEIIDGAMDTEYVSIDTPLTETTGERVKGLDDVVIINVLEAGRVTRFGTISQCPSA